MWLPRTNPVTMRRRRKRKIASGDSLRHDVDHSDSGNSTFIDVSIGGGGGGGGRRLAGRTCASNSRTSSSKSDDARFHGKIVARIDSEFEMKLLPMTVMPRFRKHARKCSHLIENDRRADVITCASIPSSDDLQAMGVHDQVEALVGSMRSFSLTKLKDWRKPFESGHVKRQQVR